MPSRAGELDRIAGVVCPRWPQVLDRANRRNGAREPDWGKQCMSAATVANVGTADFELTGDEISKLPDAE